MLEPRGSVSGRLRESWVSGGSRLVTARRPLLFGMPAGPIGAAADVSRPAAASVPASGRRRPLHLNSPITADRLPPGPPPSLQPPLLCTATEDWQTAGPGTEY